MAEINIKETKNMKDLNKYILEKKKTFELNMDERQALETTVGIALGNLGEDDDIKQFNKFIDSLSNEENENLETLYDILSDEETYKKIYQNNITPEETLLINKLYHYCDDNNMLDNQWDLIDAFEKICL